MKFFILTLFLIVLTNCLSQLSVSTTMTPSQLVQNVLLGKGISVSNVSFKGVISTTNKEQIGSFSTSGNTLTQLGFKDGIIMNTGYVKTASGSPTQNGGAYSDCTNELVKKAGGCPASSSIANDLNLFAGSSSWYDAAILEFDFIPLGDSINFKYVFFSNEYKDPSGWINYQCTDYNDKFGFIISGPGINGPFDNNGKNIALIPGTNLPVSINGINGGVVGSGMGAPNASKCIAANPSWVQNTPSSYFNGIIDGITYSGVTKILVARAKVTPCQTYHIKMFVIDIKDGGLDSGVMIEGGSFSSPGISTDSQITDASGAILTNNYITEGCSKAVLTFKAVPAPTSDYIVNYTLGGSAINNTDYTIPTSVTIPAGQSSTQLTITPTVDNVLEGDENITIQLLGQSTCSGNTAVQTPITITIKDELKITGTKTSDPTCTANTVNNDGVITLTATGGVSPYSFSLDNGTTYPYNSSTISTLGNGTYNIKVKDKDGCIASDLTAITLNKTCGCNAAVITTSKGNPTTCGGSNGKITITGLTSGLTYSLSYVKDGGTATTSTFLASGTTYDITGLTKGAYTKINVSESSCTSNDEAQTLADPGSVTITSSKSNPSSCGGTDGKITLSGLTSGLTYSLSYVKDGGTATASTFLATGTTYDIMGLTKGAYTKINVSESSCTSNDEAQTLADPGSVTITSSKSNPSSCGGTDGKITLFGLTSGLTYSLSYVKDGGTATTSTFPATGTTYDITGLGKGTYTKINVSESSCTSNDEAQTLADPGSVTITSSKSNPTSCGGIDGKITLSGLTSGLTYSLSYVKDGGTAATSTFLATGTTYDITGLTKGAYTKINVSESSCTSNDEAQTLADPVSVTITSSKSNPSSCGGTDGKITLSGLTSGLTYSLSYVKDGGTATTSTFSAIGTTYDITGLGKGTYTKINVSESSCTSNDEAQTLVNPAEPSKPTATVIHPKCGIPTGSIEIITPVGSNLSYSKDGGTFQNTKLFSSLTANTHCTITIKDNTTKCTTDSVFKIDTILMVPNPASTSLKHASCLAATGSITITAPLGSFFSYSLDGNNFQPTPTFTNLTPGNYTITTETGSNCKSTANVTIKTPPAPPVKPFAVVKQPTCTVSTGTITVTNPIGINYSYSLDNINFQSSPSFEMQESGSYTYYVMDTSTSCYSFNTATVQAPPIIPKASFTYAPIELSTLSSEAVFTNNSINATAFKWVFDDGSKISNVKNPTHLFPGNANVYNVKLTAYNNLCSHDTTVVVTVIEKPIIYVPNSFTPNSDELNNTFVPVIGGGVANENYSMYIFNRWGNIIFESHTKEIGWDGTFGNKPCPADTYIWKIEYKESSGTKARKQLVGHFNLIN